MKFGEKLDRPSSFFSLVIPREGRHVLRCALIPLGLAILVTTPILAQGREERARHVIEVLDVQPGQTIADIGCGRGWLSVAIAQVVGETGRVYAVEINARWVDAMRERRIANIVPIHSDADDVKIPEDTLDIAVLHDVASHVEKSARKKFYESVVHTLKPEGVLVVFGPHGKARALLADLRSYGWRPDGVDELLARSDDDLDVQLKAGIRFRYRNWYRYY